MASVFQTAWMMETLFPSGILYTTKCMAKKPLSHVGDHIVARNEIYKEKTNLRNATFRHGKYFAALQTLQSDIDLEELR